MAALTSTEYYLLFVIASALVLMLSNRLPPDLVAMLVLLALGLSGTVTPQQAIAGFSNPAVITIMGLFVITTTLERTGVMLWLSRRLERLSGTTEVRLIVVIMSAGALFSLIVNNVAAGAALLPLSLRLARRARVHASRVLLPLAFGTLVGGMATLFTTANILLSAYLREQGLRSLTMFDFVPTGGIVMLAGIAYMVFIGRHHLPVNALPVEHVEPPLTPPSSSPQPRSYRWLWALIITAVALGVSIVGWLPTPEAMLAGAVALVLTGCIPMDDFYRAIEWRVVFLIAGMAPISVAMRDSGLAHRFGELFIGLFEPFGALGLIAGFYLLTFLVTQVIGGQVTALVVGPLAVAAAVQADVNPPAMAVAVAIACSAAFLTPVAHPVNLLVMHPGGYNTWDFVRVGAGMSLVCFIALLVALPLCWQL